jgi:hypothetical protein
MLDGVSVVSDELVGEVPMRPKSVARLKMLGGAESR